HAPDRAATDESIFESDEEFVARCGNRLSRFLLCVCRNYAESDRAGDRDHRDHHGRLLDPLAAHCPFYELVQSRGRAEGKLSAMDMQKRVFIRTEWVPAEPAPQSFESAL